jgi:hypothetical protein
MAFSRTSWRDRRTRSHHEKSAIDRPSSARVPTTAITLAYPSGLRLGSNGDFVMGWNDGGALGGDVGNAVVGDGVGASEAAKLAPGGSVVTHLLESALQPTSDAKTPLNKWATPNTTAKYSPIFTRIVISKVRGCEYSWYLPRQRDSAVQAVTQ